MLDASVNMWTLARPLIEEWMRENRGPEARMRDTVLDTMGALERLPGLMRDLEKLGSAITEGGGLPLHPDTVAEIARRDAIEILGLPLWLIALALTAVAVALW
jgi:ubiquinone biosynthesis protein